MCVGEGGRGGYSSGAGLKVAEMVQTKVIYIECLGNVVACYSEKVTQRYRIPQGTSFQVRISEGPARATLVVFVCRSPRSPSDHRISRVAKVVDKGGKKC